MEVTPPNGPTRSHAALPEPTPEQRRAVGGALRRGRAAARSGDYAAALAIFREGLALEADDPHLLCEAGWAAMQVDDPLAEALLENGASQPGTDAVRGACLYNLGRLYERRAASLAGPAHDAYLRRAAASYASSLAVRPNNAETRRRHDALPTDARTHCPPGDRYADDEALCLALLASSTGDQPECARADSALAVEGDGPQLLIFVVTEGNFGTYYLVEHDAGLRPMAVLGYGWDRSCSWGDFEASARWSRGGSRGGSRGDLEVLIHERGEYTCGPSEYERCLDDAAEGDGDTEACTGLSESTLETTDTHHRLFCVGERCSIVGPSLFTYRPWATPGPLPEGAQLEEALECPPH